MIKLYPIIIIIIIITLLQHVFSAKSTPPHPHIIHILADDYGWADIGYHRNNNNNNNQEVQTPNLDALKNSGIELDRFYVYKICSPSRSSIQTGRNPIHVNVQNVPPEVTNSKDIIGGYQGIPTNMTGIAALLRKQNYKTHIVGKWDVGMATPYHHPKFRGYDTWLGYFHHSNDYWQYTVEKCSSKPVYDLWKYNETFDGPATFYQNGPSCSQDNQKPKNNETCVYEEEILTNEVLNIIEKHDVSTSLFLFWSMHLVHMPLQVPQKYVDKFSFINNTYRRLNHAMGNLMDENVGKVIDLLKKRGIYDNALIVFHADNGGEIMGGGLCGGNNFPLKGGKFSNWEGGIRVNAFVTGGIIPNEKVGTKIEHYITGWDWYATYASIANIDPFDNMAANANLPGIDSINMWPLLSGKNNTSPRNEIIIGDTTSLYPNAGGKTLVGGIIINDYKLIIGAKSRLYNVNQNTITGANWPNNTKPRLWPLTKLMKCKPDAKHGCLFNIKEDPYEMNNLAPSMPDLFNEMLKRIEEAQKTVYSPYRGKKDARACNIAKDKYENHWGVFDFL